MVENRLRILRKLTLAHTNMSRKKLPSRGWCGQIVCPFQVQNTFPQGNSNDTFDVIRIIISPDLGDERQARTWVITMRLFLILFNQKRLIG